MKRFSQKETKTVYVCRFKYTPNAGWQYSRFYQKPGAARGHKTGFLRGSHEYIADKSELELRRAEVLEGTIDWKVVE